MGKGQFKSTDLVKGSQVPEMSKYLWQGKFKASAKVVTELPFRISKSTSSRPSKFFAITTICGCTFSPAVIAFIEAPTSSATCSASVMLLLHSSDSFQIKGIDLRHSPNCGRCRSIVRES